MTSTRIIDLLGTDSDSAAVDEAAAALRGGKTVVFPTETVYGLGCRATSPESVRRVYEIKGRAWDKPLAAYVSSPGGAARCGAEVSAEARRLIDRFWPGPLTLLLPGPGGARIGLRCPDEPHALALIDRAGVPVAATSANRSGEEPPVCGDDAARLMDGLADVVLRGGRTRWARESTIVDLGGGEPRLVREGAIGRGEIEEALGRRLEGSGGRLLNADERSGRSSV